MAQAVIGRAPARRLQEQRVAPLRNCLHPLKAAERSGVLFRDARAASSLMACNEITRVCRHRCRYIALLDAQVIQRFTFLLIAIGLAFFPSVEYRVLLVDGPGHRVLWISSAVELALYRIFFGKTHLCCATSPGYCLLSLCWILPLVGAAALASAANDASVGPGRNLGVWSLRRCERTYCKHRFRLLSERLVPPSHCGRTERSRTPILMIRHG